MNFKIRLAALFASLLALLVFAVPSTAQAVTSPGNVQVEVVASLSQSNMLVSFENTSSGAIEQHLVCEGCVHGEGSGSYVFSEPQNMWVNPNWCAGLRHRYTNRDTGSVSTTSWKYYIGGMSGQSVFIGQNYTGPSVTARAQIYLYDC